MHENVAANMNLKVKSVAQNIHDKKLHQAIQKNVDQGLDAFMDMDQKQIEVDRLIRLNKNYKNKNEVIKIKQLINSLEFKHEQDDKIRSIIRNAK